MGSCLTHNLPSKKYFDGCPIEEMEYLLIQCQYVW